ncbi:MAG: hypothetical protein PHF00_06385 [Elusimicrobia bacterium]|nr:hypothetical protein [Elusimicrobiota bacterium]
MRKRLAVLLEFMRMVRDRGDYLILPILILVVIILAVMLVAETPVLIPFFYAIF